MKLGLPTLPFRRPNLPSPAKPTFPPPAAAHKDPLVVVMGATGAGKTRLSVDLATRFSGEIINSDKIQLYKGLDITTNKIPSPHRKNVPHHLLGEFPSAAGDVTPSLYCHHAAAAVSNILSRNRLPFLVGGSNSLIHSLLSGDASSDPFSGDTPISSASDLRYRCCFLWVDVSPKILDGYLNKRVDEMLDSGMIEELEEFYSSEIENSPAGKGVRKAIGVPEFEHYFRLFPSGTTSFGGGENDRVRRGVYEEAVRSIKENTCRLARRQVEKIERLRLAGWGLRRLDASDSFRRVVEGSDGWEEAWEREVVGPSVSAVQRFLEK